MKPVNLFDIANKQADWLAIRQKTVASNVANANTPGYKALDVQDFSAVMQNSPISLAVTNSAHMPIDGNVVESTMLHNGLRESGQVEITHSGNDVNLEAEMQKGGEIGREMTMNTAIVKAFHKMMMSVTKGGA